MASARQLCSGSDATAEANNAVWASIRALDGSGGRIPAVENACAEAETGSRASGTVRVMESLRTDVDCLARSLKEPRAFEPIFDRHFAAVHTCVPDSPRRARRCAYLREAARVAKALRTDAENVLAIVGRATAAAAGAVVQEVAKGDVIGIATGIAAIEAASSQLLSSTAKDRALWRLRRPDLLWLNDIADEAKGITETLPDFARIWRIPKNRQDVFGTRFAAMAQLQS
jgi:hypothetical protein